MSTLHALAVAGMVAAAGFLHGAEEPAWQTLFEGKFPDAFRAYKQLNFPYNSWGARAGELVAVPGNDRTDVMIRGTYANFEFSVEWRLAPGASSGIIYLVQEGPPKAVHAGLKMALVDDDKNAEAKANPQLQTGALYGLLVATNARPKAVGEWNEARVVVRTNRVEHWLNGEKVIEFDLGGEALQAAIRKSRLFKDAPELGKHTEGHIALEHGGGGVWFRNPRLRELPPPEAPEQPDSPNQPPGGN